MTDAGSPPLTSGRVESIAGGARRRRRGGGATSETTKTGQNEEAVHLSPMTLSQMACTRRWQGEKKRSESKNKIKKRERIDGGLQLS